MYNYIIQQGAALTNQHQLNFNWIVEFRTVDSFLISIEGITIGKDRVRAKMKNRNDYNN